MSTLIENCISIWGSFMGKLNIIKMIQFNCFKSSVQWDNTLEFTFISNATMFQCSELFSAPCNQCMCIKTQM